MFRFQFRRMLRCREFRAAVLLAMLVICGNLLRGAWSSHGMDASRILSAGEWYTGNGLSFGWSVFSALWPFLVVLPFATSFIGEKKDQIVVPAVSRGSYGRFMVSKVVVAGLGSMMVIGGALLAELLVSYVIYPVNHNVQLQEYFGINFIRQLLGTNQMYRSCAPETPLYGLYLNHPFLFELVYVIINSGFAFLCGCTISALSLCMSNSRIALFLPLYIIVYGSLRLRTILWDKAIAANSVFVNPYWMDYLAPFGIGSLSGVYVAIVCGILAAVTIGCTTLGIRNGFRAVQG